MVLVLRGILPVTGWSYNLRTAPTFSRLFIPVFIEPFYFIILVIMIEEEKIVLM